MAFFCHQCNRTVTVSGGLECDTCHGEFVEEIDANDEFFDTSGEGGGPNATNTTDDDEEGANRGAGRVFIMHRDGDDGGPAMVYEGMNPFMGMLASPDSPFSRMFSQLVNQRGGGSRTGDTPTSSAAGASRARAGAGAGGSRAGASGGAPRPSSSTNYGGSDSLMNFFNQLMTNLADNAEQGGGGATPTRLTFHIGGDGAGGGRLFSTLHGNLNDYAWGEGGVDAIVTQLLNQFESGGQAENVSAEDLERLPMTEVNAKQVENGTQCATCMETFTLAESVARLDCQHIFHRPCIVPWLKKHNTCPICRKVVDPRTWSAGTAGPSSSPKITDVDELD